MDNRKLSIINCPSLINKPGQYWQFSARDYSGTIKTKLRFRLDIGGGQVFYSNEFEGAISAQQFEKQSDVEPAEKQVKPDRGSE